MADRDELMRESPSQTAGPYLHIGCTPSFAGIAGVFANDPGSSMLGGEVAGQRIVLSGCVFDGQGEPVRDAMIEIWQANAAGHYVADDAFSGWGRCAVDLESGEYRFETIKPGAVATADGGVQAPHITLWIVARGINIGLHTRVYFDDEPDANAADPILLRVEPLTRIRTLLAKPEGDGRYRFDVHLQGERETVFFDA